MQETPSKPDESETHNDVTPEEQSTDKDETNEDVKTNSTPLKEAIKIEMEFKTPEKSNHHNQPAESENVSVSVSENDTPKKPSTPRERHLNVKENTTPLKELKNTETEFKTPEKSNRSNQSLEVKLNETPGKPMNSFDLKLDQSCDGEDGMISTTEQARLLIAASKTPSKSVNRTPVKQNTPSGKRSIENSPVTPGKHRRVELITLASPKAKRIKQM